MAFLRVFSANEEVHPRVSDPADINQRVQPAEERVPHPD